MNWKTFLWIQFFISNWKENFHELNDKFKLVHLAPARLRCDFFFLTTVSFLSGIVNFCAITISNIFLEEFFLKTEKNGRCAVQDQSLYKGNRRPSQLYNCFRIPFEFQNEFLKSWIWILWSGGWQLPRIFVHLWPESLRIPIIFFFKIFIL